MFTRFTDNINELKSLGKVYTNVEWWERFSSDYYIEKQWGDDEINEAMDDDEKSDEEMTLFTRRFNKIFKKRQFSRRQSIRNFSKEKELKESIICFECKKPGHIKLNCLKLRKDSRKDKKGSKENFEKFKKAFAI